jgi:hypothetical protein
VTRAIELIMRAGLGRRPEFAEAQHMTRLGGSPDIDSVLEDTQAAAGRSASCSQPSSTLWHRSWLR